MKSLIAAAALAAFAFAMPAAAQDEPKELTPAAVQQIALANQLIALGDARNDALLLLAAAKLQRTIDDELPLSAASLGNDEVLERAKTLAAGHDDLLAIAEDIETVGERGCSVRYGCSNPYIKIR